MTYTIWMHDRKIGETRFELRPSRRRRAGEFHPTEFGLTMLPRITAMGPALFAFGDRSRGAELEVRNPSGRTMAWESVGITDIQELLAAARARRPDLIEKTPPALLETVSRNPMKFIISLTLRERQDGITRTIPPADAEPVLEC